MNVDAVTPAECVYDNNDLVKEQQEDVSCWDMAKVNKGWFVIDNGILYHIDKVDGQRVCQMCVLTCTNIQTG